MRRTIKWLALLVVLWPTSAFSSSVVSEAEKLLANNQPVKAYQWLNQHQQQLNGSAKGLYMYGVLALRLGHQQQAFVALQQVVDLAPHNIGAQLDLAMAAIQVGRLQQANTLLTQLSARNDIPHGVALLLASYKRKVDNLLASVNKSSTTFTMGLGYNNNVNLGLLTEQVTLDTINGVINLNIDPSSRAVASPYEHVLLTHHDTWQGAAVTAQADITNYSISTQYNTALVEFAVAKEVAVASQAVQLSIATQWLSLGDEASENLIVKATTLLPGAKKLELQWDQQRKLKLQLSASATLLGAQGQWFAGVEQQTARAGYVGVKFPWNVSDNILLELGMDYATSQDLNAYSPTIFGDKAKMTQTVALRSSLSLPMSKDQRAFVNIVWQNQSSNIALFHTRRASIEIGITKKLR